MPLDLGDVVKKAVSLQRPHQRVIIGLAGIPGSGKSTLAESLALAFVQTGITAQVVSMDGFHYASEVLKQQGLLERKGSPETFDVQSFYRILQTLKGHAQSATAAARSIMIPIYSREIHEPVSNAVHIPSSTQFVILEGNYLYFQAPIWRDVGRLIDLKLFLDRPLEEARERLILRHRQGGLSEEEAAEKYDRVDLPNSQLVLGTKKAADWII